MKTDKKNQTQATADEYVGRVSSKTAGKLAGIVAEHTHMKRELEERVKKFKAEMADLYKQKNTELELLHLEAWADIFKELGIDKAERAAYEHSMDSRGIVTREVPALSSQPGPLH